MPHILEKVQGSNKRSVPIYRTVSSNWNQRVPTSPKQLTTKWTLSAISAGHIIVDKPILRLKTFDSELTNIPLGTVKQKRVNGRE